MKDGVKAFAAVFLLGAIAGTAYLLTRRKAGEHRWNVGDTLLCGETQWEILAIESREGVLYYLAGIVGTTISDWFRVDEWDSLPCQLIG